MCCFGSVCLCCLVCGLILNVWVYVWFCCCGCDRCCDG